MNPTSRQAARYPGGFFTRRVGSADDSFKALHPRSTAHRAVTPWVKLRGITGYVINLPKTIRRIHFFVFV